MATSRQKQLFEELDLLGQTEPVNPYLVLGLDPEFARSILQEDRSGATLRTITQGLYRALSRIYHPDINPTGHERFRVISDANERIDTASPEALSRWTKVERVARSVKLDKLVAKQLELGERAASLIQNGMELGQHPEHFSRLPYAQGVLLDRSHQTLLMRQANGWLRITRGVSLSPAKGELSSGAETQAFDFQTFLRKNESFGLEPDTNIVGYVDETGQASILAKDLTFEMDITEPVNAYLQTLARFSGSDEIGLRRERGSTPTLFITSVPTPGTTARPESRMLVFPERESEKANAKNFLSWMNLSIVGSISDSRYFSRIRHAGQSGVEALPGGQRAGNVSHFNLAAITIRKLVEDDPGYSPLISAGNSLLLYNETLRMPVVTDAKIVGVLGKNALGSTLNN